MAFFSIIIPLYNKEKFVAKTLESTLAQTFSDYEILIIDDGSTDKSLEIAKQFTDSRLQFFSKENGGVSSARNFGIQRATSDYITFLDADDLWYPQFLETMHRTVMDFPEQQVFSGAFEIETAKKVVPAQFSVGFSNVPQVVDYFSASSKDSIIWTSCAVFHQSVFEKVGDFDTAIKSGQDIDLWIRIGLEYAIVFNPKILARYVFDAESLSKDKKHMDAKINFAKFETAEKNHPELKKYLDLNRYAMALKFKMFGDQTTFIRYSNAIDRKNLPMKKQILLAQPGFVLRKLVQLNRFLVNVGLSASVFR